MNTKNNYNRQMQGEEMNQFKSRSQKPFDKYEKMGTYHWVAGEQNPLYMEHVAYIKSIFASAADMYPHNTVLDVGCGDGFITKHLADLGLDVLAIDTNENGLRLARKQFGPIETRGTARFENRDFFDLKEAPGFILASDVVEHLYRPDEFVNHLRALNPVVTVISTPLSRPDGKLWDPAYHVMEYGKDAFINLFRGLIKDYGITYTVRPEDHECKTQYLILERREEALNSLLKSMRLFRREFVKRNGCQLETLVALSDVDIKQISSSLVRMFNPEVMEEYDP